MTDKPSKVDFEVTGMVGGLEAFKRHGMVVVGSYVIVRGVPEGFTVSDAQGNTWVRHGDYWSSHLTKAIRSDDIMIYSGDP